MFKPELVRSRHEAGFTLVELMITMTIFVLVIAAASQIFTGLLTQFKQQSKMGESNIEGIIGLDILRRDIEHAGFGLPWVIPPGATYNEADHDLTYTSWVDCDFNDGPPDNLTRGTDLAGASNPPGAIRSGDGYNPFPLNSHPSDVLVIKSANVGMSGTSQTWMELGFGNDISKNGSSGEIFNNGDRIIVISPGSSDSDSRSLVIATGTTTWKTTFGNTSTFAPLDNSETRIIYGIDPDTGLRMPFNRADYYVRIPSNMPTRCAPNTGVLYKSTVNQSNGMHKEYPLLDCVADMQVKFILANANGVVQWPPADDISNLTAKQIRDQLKEVRVYIVAQEGQKDTSYDFSMNNTRQDLSVKTVVSPDNSTSYGTAGAPAVSLVNLKTLVGNPEYKYYRWKLYTIAAQPKNLR